MLVALFWNVRGLNRPDKLRVVKQLIRDTHPDLVGFFESKKESFTSFQLFVLDPNEAFSWSWLPAKNTAGGILVGVKSDVFDILSIDILEFFVACLIRDKKNSGWRFISVYGSAYDEHKLEFINELHNTMDAWLGPIVAGVILILLEVVLRKGLALLTPIG